MPLSRHNWQRAGKTIPLEQGFQFLSYRSGVTAADDFVQLDGFFGRGRNPYHVNALYLLRMGGKLLLSGYDNQVAVRRQGMVEPHVAQAAALEAAASCGDAFYVRATVPDMPFSAWTRHILYLKGLYAIVLDEVRARAPGRFDIDCRWRVLGAASPMPRAPRCVQSRTGVTIACSVPASASTNGSHVTQSWSCKLGAGDTVALGNLVYLAAQRGKATHTAEPVGRRGLLVRGDGKALACFGPRRLGAIEVKAEAAYLSRTRLFGAKATLIACGTPLLTADKPVGFLWNLAGGVLEIDASQPTHLEVQTEKGRAPRDLQAGRHTLSGCSPAPGAITALTKALDTMEPTPPQQAEQPQPLATGAKWEPDWTLKLDGRVSLLACSAHTRPPTVWAVAGDKLLVKVNADGKSLARRELSSRARSLWAASSRAQANAFAALVGCDDDHLLAFAADGAPRWNAEARIAPEFKIGDRYRAPWFTDPRRKHGVFSLLAGDLWGSGQEEIALGRSSTVELRSLDGRLLKRLPTHWGDNTALAAVRLPEPRLLVGKFYTGIPGLSIVDRKREVLTDSACAGIPRGATRMSAWMQQGVSHLATSDLDGDGAEETLVARSGHWNELAVYNAKGQCLWLASFGPAPSRSRFITGLAVADLDGDGKQEVAVGMANGWLCVFDARGQALWQRRLPSAVRALAAVRPGLVVGEAARVHLLSPSGNTVATAELEGAISALAPLGGTTCVAAGTASGDLVRLDVGKTVRRTAP